MSGYLDPRSFLLSSDLAEILSRYQTSLKAFQNSRILVTGGTGFVGRWLVSSLVEANMQLDLNISLCVMTRNGKAAQNANLSLADKSVNIIEHDITLPFPPTLENFDYVFHAATPSQTKTGSQDIQYVEEVTRQGTLNLIEFLLLNNFRGKILHTSSGAVYGNSITQKGPVHEFDSSEVNLLNRYGSSKLASEKMLTDYAAKNDVIIVNARLFAFAGPLISLNEHFAIGNFLGQARQEGIIEIKGNPQTMRSYLYPTDMIGWIITGIHANESSFMHVCSELGFNMFELAELVQGLYPNSKIIFTNPESSANVYLGKNQITTSRFNVKQNISLYAGLQRWDRWLTVGGM